ncbi:hypothetical protein [Comamonas terrae]|uniref:Uncharacterized protein n=1 Tax=Comamonas terrae TaxID=673548 RepID=A0ABW5UQY3_9BURK|nr:hypothetical protein [Comamonas terrae]
MEKLRHVAFPTGAILSGTLLAYLSSPNADRHIFSLEQTIHTGAIT